MFKLFAQLVHAIHCRGLRGDGPRGTSLFTFPDVEAHIVRFTAAGIRGLAGKAERGKPDSETRRNET